MCFFQSISITLGVTEGAAHAYLYGSLRPKYCVYAAVRAEANEKASDALQAIAAIPLVKTVQMVRLQRVILVVGTLSIFEAALQRWLDCKNGFKQANETPEQKKAKLLTRKCGCPARDINVLKNDQRRRYNELVEKAGDMDFKVKMQGERFFSDGGVSEVTKHI